MAPRFARVQRERARTAGDRDEREIAPEEELGVVSEEGDAADLLAERDDDAAAPAVVDVGDAGRAEGLGRRAVEVRVGKEVRAGGLFGGGPDLQGGPGAATAPHERRRAGARIGRRDERSLRRRGGAQGGRDAGGGSVARQCIVVGEISGVRDGRAEERESEGCEDPERSLHDRCSPQRRRGSCWHVSPRRSRGHAKDSSHRYKRR